MSGWPKTGLMAFSNSIIIPSAILGFLTVVHSCACLLALCRRGVHAIACMHACMHASLDDVKNVEGAARVP